MRLILEFKTRNEGYVLDKQEMDIGLEFIDYVREQVGKFVPIEAFADHVERVVAYSYEVEIPENLARKSRLFLETWKVQVLVDDLFLNKYMGLFYKVDEDAIIPIWELSRPLLLQDWEKAGFPIDWKGGEK